MSKAMSKPNPVTKRGMFRMFEPDPIVYELSAVIFNSGMSYTMIAERGGLSASTVAKVAYCETQRPQMKTMTGILTGCGYSMQWISGGGTRWDFRSPEKAIDEMRKVQRVHQNKKLKFRTRKA